MDIDAFDKKVIGIHGVPRSGTSWLAQIFNSDPRVRVKFQPLFSYAFKNVLDEHSSYKMIRKFYNDIWHNESDLFLNLKDPEIHKNYPAFENNEKQDFLVFKQVHHHYVLQNLLDKDKTIKFILLIRNPLSILASWYKAPREFKPEYDLIEEWRFAKLKNDGLKENYFGFEKWKEATNLFLSLSHSYPDRVYLLEYGQLLSNTRKSIEELFYFLEMGKLGQQTFGFIDESKKNNHSDPNSVYKSKTNDDAWKSSLPYTVIEKIKSDDLFIKLNKKYNWLNHG